MEPVCFGRSGWNGTATKGVSRGPMEGSPTNNGIRSALGRGGIGRAVLSSLIATAADYALFVALVTVGTWAALATLWGCVLGAIINFTLNRHWAFEHRGRVGGAMVRYVTTSGASALANAALVALATTGLGLPGRSSWLIARALVFLGLTYPLFRRWVFSEPEGR
jgi:putative flippase GtrA